MDYLIAVAPSIGVGILFYFVVRAFVTADRRERAADAKAREEIREEIEKETNNG